MQNKRLSSRVLVSLVSLMLVSLIAFAGCGKEQPSGTKPPAAREMPKPAYPTKPIKVIIASGVGSTADTQSRGFLPYLEKELGVPLIIENLGESGGIKGRDALYLAEADGYTIGITSMPIMQIQELIEQTQFKTADFTYVYNIFGNNWKTIVVRKDSPYQSFKDLLEASKVKPIIMGSGGGYGGSAELQSVLLKRMGFNHEFVPFKGTGESASALLGGHVEGVFNDVVGMLRFKNDVRFLVLHAPERMPYLPDVPTFKELGYEGMEIPYILGILAPPALPEDKLDVLVKAVERVLENPEFQKWSETTENFLQPIGPSDYRQYALKLFEQVKAVKDLFKR